MKITYHKDILCFMEVISQVVIIQKNNGEINYSNMLYKLVHNIDYRATVFVECTLQMVKHKKTEHTK